MNEWGFVWEIKTFEQGRIIFLYAWATEANEFVWKKKKASSCQNFNRSGPPTPQKKKKK